jgi:hypothetical protein
MTHLLITPLSALPTTQCFLPFPLLGVFDIRGDFEERKLLPRMMTLVYMTVAELTFGNVVQCYTNSLMYLDWCTRLVVLEVGAV